MWNEHWIVVNNFARLIHCCHILCGKRIQSIWLSIQLSSFVYQQENQMKTIVEIWFSFIPLLLSLLHSNESILISFLQHKLFPLLSSYCPQTFNRIVFSLKWHFDTFFVDLFSMQLVWIKSWVGGRCICKD